MAGGAPWEARTQVPHGVFALGDADGDGLLDVAHGDGPEARLFLGARLP